MALMSVAILLSSLIGLPRTSGRLPPTLQRLADRNDPSWLQDLRVDPEQDRWYPNQHSRPVRSGHYVVVRPTPIPCPELVAHSPEMAAALGLDAEACQSPEFVALGSGNWSAVAAPDGDNWDAWATPYALSIFGEEQHGNCPFRTGEGYGDGRALSFAEVVTDDGARWELQWKGAGRTPFSRAGDGRAVLRSSLREFLASEAMHHLGVPTTRALSLVRSRCESVMRPWYSNASRPLPVDSTLWRSASPSDRQALLDGRRDPDRFGEEPCAITTRASPSFLRVGHIELYARRVAGPKALPAGPERDRALADLRAVLRHTLAREFPQCLAATESWQSQLLCLLDEASQRLAHLTAEWVRVGFVQGNFNSDNCHVAGRTLDYGPFGFVQRFEALWNMWQDGGEHFGFLNQPVAGTRNFQTLVAAVSLQLDAEGKGIAEQRVSQHAERAQANVDDVWRRKLGLRSWDAAADALLGRALVLMEALEADYTLFWRQLADLPASHCTGDEASSVLLAPLHQVFYRPLSALAKKQLLAWLRDWLRLLQSQGEDAGSAALRMRRTSPKFVPREWMLIEAYTAADPAPLTTQLLAVFRDPYGEAAQSGAYEACYYRRAPDETYEGIGLGGAAYMSCSS